MQINKIDDDISVSPQIVASDIPTIVEAGFRTIICNRPDGEENGQQIYTEIEEAANAAGIKIIYQPVDGRNVTDGDAALFGEIIRFCRKAGFCILPYRNALHRFMVFNPFGQVTR